MVKNQNLEVDKFFYADKMDTRNYLFTCIVARARKKKPHPVVWEKYIFLLGK